LKPSVTDDKNWEPTIFSNRVTTQIKEKQTQSQQTNEQTSILGAAVSDDGFTSADEKRDKAVHGGSCFSDKDDWSAETSYLGTARTARRQSLLSSMPSSRRTSLL
jgi:hypothetical protein